jgi:hypothetical protein
VRFQVNINGQSELCLVDQCKSLRISFGVKYDKAMSNVAEGVRRIRSLGYWIMGLGGVGATLWMAVAFSSGRWGLAELVVLVAAPLLLGAVVRVFAWVLEGFWR